MANERLSRDHPNAARLRAEIGRVAAEIFASVERMLDRYGTSDLLADLPAYAAWSEHQAQLAATLRQQTEEIKRLVREVNSAQESPD